jgi:hypothetical protein
MKRTNRNKRTNGVFIFVLIAVFVVSMGISYFYLKGKFEFNSTFIEEITSRQDIKGHKEQKEDLHRLYESKETASQNGDETSAGEDSSLAAAEDIIRKYVKALRSEASGHIYGQDGVIYVDLEMN